MIRPLLGRGAERSGGDARAEGADAEPAEPAQLEERPAGPALTPAQQSEVAELERRKQG